MTTECETECETLKKLCKVALECNKMEKKEIGDRVINFFQCKNITEFMVIATFKCLEERHK